MDILFDVPYRELSLIRNNDRDYIFTFEDLNSPLIPVVSYSDNNQTSIAQRSLFAFPAGSSFYFRAYDEEHNIDIQKTGSYNTNTKEITVSFTGSDTTNIERDRRVGFEMDVVYSNGKRYTILEGDIVIFATRKLNV